MVLVSIFLVLWTIFHYFRLGDVLLGFMDVSLLCLGTTNLQQSHVKLTTFLIAVLYLLRPRVRKLAGTWYEARSANFIVGSFSCYGEHIIWISSTFCLISRTLATNWCSDVHVGEGCSLGSVKNVRICGMWIDIAGFFCFNDVFLMGYYKMFRLQWIIIGSLGSHVDKPCWWGFPCIVYWPKVDS